MPRTDWCDLYLESATDYQIIRINSKGHKTIVPLSEAQQIWETGRVRDFNLAFDRLARMNFDLDAVKAFYRRDQCA